MSDFCQMPQADCAWTTFIHNTRVVRSSSAGVHRVASLPHVHHSSDIQTLLWLARGGPLGDAEDKQHILSHLKSFKEAHGQDLHIQRLLNLVWKMIFRKCSAYTYFICVSCQRCFKATQLLLPGAVVDLRMTNQISISPVITSIC